MSRFVEEKKEPQIKTPRVTPLEGVSTYALQGIRVRGVENPQGFGIDERRLIDSNFQHIFVAYLDGNLINSPQRAQSSQRLFPRLNNRVGGA